MTGMSPSLKALPAAANPFAIPGMEKMIGHKDCFKVRFGDFRVGIRADDRATGKDVCRRQPMQSEPKPGWPIYNERSVNPFICVPLFLCVLMSGERQGISMRLCSLARARAVIVTAILSAVFLLYSQSQLQVGFTIVTEAGVAATQATSAARIYVANIGTYIGVALANTADQQAEVFLLCWTTMVQLSRARNENFRPGDTLPSLRMNCFRNCRGHF
jgi:hypothetical protein